MTDPDDARDIASADDIIPDRAYVTTTDTCSNCGAKLTNAETARLNWQGEAARLSKELAEAVWLLSNSERSRRIEWNERRDAFLERQKGGSA